ncbi:hypothetical protein MSAN_00586200 [Mycena sanguinolenta]|uniref:Uncharacterized protein n=1 Tax=Mycena sanguinolenta TaxID=230812 RepID=A0A8H6ZAB9_9AGAR|nr:hypothetical protein MSAN_00586200 [Mycena sanguinolenta]
MCTMRASAAPVSARDLHPKSKLQREDDVLTRYPMPRHWEDPELNRPFGRLNRIVFNLLCLTSIGHTGLKRVWGAIKLEQEGDDSVWSGGIERICDRLNNMLLVAGLLLTTSAAFITTTPPRASTVNYTLRGPYICILGSFGLLIGGIIVASVCVLVLGKIRPYWCETVLYGNRFNVYSTMILISYPLFAIGLAAVLLAFGALTAVWCAEDPGVQRAAVLLLCLPIAMAILFAIVCATHTVQPQDTQSPVCRDQVSTTCRLRKDESLA